MSSEIKVFGIGLPKTGTTTLGHCLKTLGFNHYDTPWDIRMQMFEESQVNDYSTIRSHINQYDSFEDIPWHVVYQQIDKEYANAKFVLTLRKDASVWLSSMKNQALRGAVSLRHSRKILFGFQYPHRYEAFFLDFYEQHIRKVNEYFAGKDNFIEVCWERGDNWETLCPFLNRPTPDGQFPHANKGPKRNRLTMRHLANRMLSLLVR